MAFDPISALITVGSSLLGGLFGDDEKEVTQTQEWNPPEWISQYAPEMMARAYELSNVYGTTPFAWNEPFVAPMTQEQIDAIAGTRGMAMPDFSNQEKWWYQDAAQNNALMNALAGTEGEWQNPYGDPTSPYLENMWAGYQSQLGEMNNPLAALNNPYLTDTFNQFQQGTSGTNPLAGLDNPYLTNAFGQYQQGTSGTNPYADMNNPYLEAGIKAMRGNAEDTFNRTMGASTDAAAARQRAYGGSAYNELKGVQSKELADSLNQAENAMRSDAFNRAAGLSESALGRGLQSANTLLAGQLGQYGLAANLGESGLNRAQQSANALMSGKLGQYGLSAGLLENAFGRQAQGLGNELSQRFGQYGNAGNMMENVYGRQMQGLGMTPALNASDLEMQRQLLASGEMARGLEQQQLEGRMDSYWRQVNQPLQAMDNMLRWMGALSGPQAMATTQTSSGNPMAGALGGGLFGLANAGSISNALGSLWGSIGNNNYNSGFSANTVMPVDPYNINP